MIRRRLWVLGHVYSMGVNYVCMEVQYGDKLSWNPSIWVELECVLQEHIARQ